QEFYASVREKESKRPHGYIWEDITVRGEEVHVTLREICKFYNVSYYEAGFLDNIDLDNFKDINMDNIVNYLTKGRGERNHRSDTEFPSKFNQEIMFPTAKMWMQFLCTKITPAMNISNVNTFRAIFVVWNSVGKVDMHRSMDISQHEMLYKQLEGWGFLPSPNDSAMQKGWGSNGNKQVIHEGDEKLNK
ncbi:hypothetical protein Goshw_019979, partial [Gossypium schwendimanii]|nr:hypothetical protein [Gossypium schwendimanii]